MRKQFIAAVACLGLSMALARAGENAHLTAGGLDIRATVDGSASERTGRAAEEPAVFHIAYAAPHGILSEKIRVMRAKP